MRHWHSSAHSDTLLAQAVYKEASQRFQAYHHVRIAACHSLIDTLEEMCNAFISADQRTNWLCIALYHEAVVATARNGLEWPNSHLSTQICTESRAATAQFV